ncbi:MAG TPA: hypothetical protein ENH82_05530 [bacterium]|nr:hypothetical protein [bacterium]
MNILALDCATRTGWATLINGQVESGVQDFTKKRGESNGMLYVRFNAWLEEMGSIALTDIYTGENVLGVFFDLIIYEQAHMRGGYATELLHGLQTRVQEFAVKIGAEYTTIHTGTLKKYITGKGNASKKDMCDWFLEKMRRKPIDDNEADAMALLMYAKTELG